MITLERFAYTEQGTFGKLTFADFSCYTIESQWDNNAFYTSCVPEGLYNIKKYKSIKFGKVYGLTGLSVSLIPEINFDRSNIVIHPANVVSELEGCIGLGDSLGYVKSSWAVLNSENTVNKFYDIVHAFDNIPFLIKFKKVDTNVIL